LAQIVGNGDLKVKTRSSPFLASLKEGDKVSAEVLSSKRGVVMMKTDDGQAFRAKLDPNVEFFHGDKVLLEVAGKENGIVNLSIRREETAAGEASRDTAAETAGNTTGSTTGETTEQLWLVRDFGDKSLLPYASKLAMLNITVTEETALLMRELMTQHPGMTIDEAAFLASNKLTGDESLMNAALALLSGGEKTDEMLVRLLAMLELPESSAGPSVAQRPVLDFPHTSPDMLPSPDFQLPIVNSQLAAPTAQAAPITDWITLFGENSAGIMEAALTGEPASAPVIQTSISQINSIMQSANVENLQEFSHNSVIALENQDIILQNQTSPVPPALETPLSAPDTPLHFVSPNSTEGVYTPLSTTPLPDTPHPTLHTPHSTETTAAMIAGILSEIPEFRSTPAPALERFTNMLLRVARDSESVAGGDTEKLADLLNKLFTRIEKSDRDPGARLKIAREEIFTRLTLVEEAISRSSPPAREEMLENTRKLMDHVRLLNNIDQFAYLQLPVKIGEERKTAELYLFRKKGGKRLDPENINILLALDLENMGRWEALINFRKKDVSVRMKVRGAEEKEHFSENTVLLHELLAEAGFKLVSTDIAYTTTETTPLTALSALDRYLTGPSGRIDFKI